MPIRAEDAEPAPASPVKRVAVVKKLAPAANLGGPAQADSETAAATEARPGAHDLVGCRRATLRR